MQRRATLTGLFAIFLWSTLVGLIKSVSDGVGPIAGAALIYSASAVILALTVGLPNLRTFPRAYLVLGSTLFVLYEICLSLSLGFTHSHQQAIEVGMVNYLWPGMTIGLTVLVYRQKVSLLMVPGLLLAVIGICRVLAADHGFSWHDMHENIMDNPLSFGLALCGAMIWAIYCVVTKKMAQGCNGITLFFVLTALALWLTFLFSPQPLVAPSPRTWLCLIFAALAMGGGYAAWNTGILHGNVTLLAAASYFIPVLSALLAAVMLQTPLPLSFWQGAAMVSVGSLLCWWSTRAASPRRESSA
ncbi:aromatic amino acid DMT transporter YddG [Pantoea sp. Mb-10]|uniref:aromatic amino acid DMT transporter YddG n=1 Tax=unclassified Pantoea TaxID=2630326 RepID=UPI001E2E37CE|nr:MULTISPECIES: aromatic amino acid DMT transporter YddG [unclassified Pantoea]MCE0491211.1 aromatic amino acid DMT transporter YddG [Pantoea sp. Mb-10]MCE0502700.1 aromatic amino acid DMT transporter YddG [Pantoea sp. Pb-8]